MKLKIAGVEASSLAARFGTPVYVYDQGSLENRMREFADAFRSPEFDCHVAYASKAFCCIAMMELVQREGLWADVVSGGELYTAVKAGFNMKHILFHGNSKTDAELELALESGVGTIVVDNLSEAGRLAFLAQHYPQAGTRVLLRINPGVEAHTHAYIVTADIDSKFGISITRPDEICETCRILHESPALTFAGFHTHIGSQIFEPEAFAAEIDKVCSFAKQFQDQTGIQVSCLDLGGGFAARYTDKDDCPPIPVICRQILEAAARAKKQYGLQVKELIIEPGRSIAAEAGYTLYTVDGIKDTDHRRYVFVNGGMNDNIRPALYQAEYDADLADHLKEPKDEVVTIAGKCCESGDIIASDIRLQHAEPGDILAVYTTGAYGQSMASNYNRLAVPGTLFVKDGLAHWVIRPQTPDDLIRNDLSLNHTEAGEAE